MGLFRTISVPRLTARSIATILGSAFLLAIILFMAISYYPATRPKIDLTAEERGWLTLHPEIRIGIRETPPLTMKAEKDGTYQGLTIDYINIMGKRLGINFKLIYYPSWRKLLDGTKNRDVDILATGTITLERASFLDFTPPYIQLHNKIIARKEIDTQSLKLSDMAGMKVAVVENSSLYSFLENSYPKLRLVATDDEISALEAVSFGEVNAAVMEMARASYYIDREKITNLTNAGDAGYPYNFSFASRNDWPLLNSILGKALYSISKKERKQLTEKWIFQSNSGRITGRTFWITIGGLASLALAINVVFWGRAMRRKVALNTAELKQELAERERVENELRRVNRTLMVLGKSHEILMQFSEERPLYEAICKHLVEVGMYRFAMICLVQQGGKFQPVAQYGINDPSATDTTRTSMSLFQPGGTVNPVDYPQQTSIDDIGEECHQSAPFTVRLTAITIPLWGAGAVIGTIEIRRIDENAFDQEEISLLTELSENLSYAVVAMRLREENKTGEDAIRKLSQAIEQCPVSIVITDRTGKIEYVNPYFCKSTGYLPEEAIGRNPRILKSGIHSTEFYQALWDLITGGFEWHGELCNRKKNGELFWESASISPVRNINGEITNYIAVKEDITDQKKAYNELQLAKSVAEAATRAKSEFLANMSHEIRTPMNAVMGMIYLVQQTNLSEKQRLYMTKAETAAGSLLRIINDILDFSKIEAGHMQLESIPFLLSDVLKKLADVATINIGDKDVELLITAAAKVPDRLIGDPLRLGQVLLNLVGNATKFTEKGEVILSVVTPSIADHQATLRFSVQDTGIGVTSEQKETLFAAFSQADSSTTRRFGGTGLGLAISRQLIEIMGGEISVESEPGKGSRFSFLITFDLEKGNSPTLSEIFCDISSLRLLYAGGSSNCRAHTGMMLASFGIKITLIEDLGQLPETGMTGMESIRDRYDLVILDAGVSQQTTGVSLQLLDNGLFKKVPVLLLATDRQLTDLKKSTFEIPEALLKPATPINLLNALAARAASGLAGSLKNKNQLPEFPAITMTESAGGKDPREFSDHDKIAGILNDLAIQLANNNLGACSLVKDLKKKTAGQPFRTEIEKLDAAVESLNFREAISILKRLAGMMKIGIT